MYTEKRRKTFRAGFGKGKSRNDAKDRKSFESQPKNLRMMNPKQKMLLNGLHRKNREEVLALKKRIHQRSNCVSLLATKQAPLCRNEQAKSESHNALRITRLARKHRCFH